MDRFTEATSLYWHQIQWVALQRTNSTTNSFRQDATMNTDAATKSEEYYRLTQHARAHDVSGLPVMIRASVIIFVIVCNVQLSVQFSYLLIRAFGSENIFFKIILLYNFSHEPEKLSEKAN